MIFQNYFLIVKSFVYPRHLKKEISILSNLYIKKSYLPVNFGKTAYFFKFSNSDNFVHKFDIIRASKSN